MEAVYPLRKSPACFNFVDFICAAKTHGATSVVFDTSEGYSKKYSPEITEQRMKTIVEPICELAGMPFRYGVRDYFGIDCGYHSSSPVRAHRWSGRLEKLKTIKPAGTERYTVTMRDYDRIPKRNSNREAWLKFAEDIGAYVIEDWNVSRIHLHDRMALYAGAEMNFGVVSGPMALCEYSDYPYIMLMKYVDTTYMTNHCRPVGSCLPWANEMQKNIWTDDDSYEGIWLALEAAGFKKCGL